MVVTAVLTTSTYLEVRSFERSVERELRETADHAARAVVDDLKSRGVEFDPADVRDILNELIEANPALRSLSIFEADRRTVEVLASTSSEERAEASELARDAMSAGAERSDADARRVSVAVPLLRAGRSLAVVASVSIGRRRAGAIAGPRVAMRFAMPTVLLVTLLIDAVTRRVVHRPIAELQTHDPARIRTAISPRARRYPARRARDGGRRAQRHAGPAGAGERRAPAARAGGDLGSCSFATPSSKRAINVCSGCRRRSRAPNAWPPSARWPRSVAHQVGTPLNLVSGYVQMIREDPQTQTVRAPAPRDCRGAVVAGHARPADHARRGAAANTEGHHQPRPRSSIARARLPAAPGSIGRAARRPAGRSAARRRCERAAARARLLNLMTNAVDAMPEGGTLSIRGAATGAGRAAGGGRLRSRNRRPILLPHLFEPWVTTKPVGHGTGLGLWPSCARCCRRTEARFTPPTVTAAARSSPSTCRGARRGRASPGSGSALIGSSCIPILVVDDDRETCRFITELIAAENRRIVSEQDPASALRLLRQEHVDLMVSDINLNALAVGSRSAARVQGPRTPTARCC